MKLLKILCEGYHCFYVSIFACLFFSPRIFAAEDSSTSNDSFSGATSSCKEMLSSFAYFSSNFTSCAIRNARPIKLCQECVNFYFDVKSVYSAILHIEDMGGDLCRDQLINLDRLQVVDSGFNYVDQLWARASCNSCFIFDHGKPRVTPEISEILNISAVLEECIQSYRNETLFPDNSTCSHCQDIYLKLNELYNNMKADSGDINFCMDIIDLMNTTRFMWSKTLGCCNDRKRPEKTFISLMSGILIASCLFYIMVFTFTRKAEHPVLPQKRWKEKFTKRSSISSAISS